MQILEIASRQNPRLKQIRSVRDGQDLSLLFLEGSKLIQEGLASRLRPRMAAVTEEFLQKEKSPEWLARLEDSVPVLIKVPGEIMKGLSGVKTPPGAILLCSRKRKSRNSLPPKSAFVVILHQVQEPGNLGSILRTARAAGANAALLTAGCADPFSPRALRGSMGSALHLPLVSGLSFPNAVKLCRRNGLQVFAADPEGEMQLWETNLAIPIALVFGSEGQGLARDDLRRCDHTIQIPLADFTESLNVSASAAVLCFEVRRQKSSRRFRR